MGDGGCFRKAWAPISAGVQAEAGWSLDVEATEGIQALDDGGGYGEWVGVDWTTNNHWEEL